MDIPTSARNAGLQDLVEILNVQHLAKHDAVVPAAAIRAQNGTLVIEGMGFGAEIGEGFEAGPGEFTPTAIMDGQIAGKLDIPVKYLRRMREERIDLYDANVNGWLQGITESEWSEAYQSFSQATIVAPDPRSFVVRTFKNDQHDGPGIGRALLSDRFGMYDNLDMLMALLEGVRETGMEVEVTGADLSETRMIVRMNAPGLTTSAEKLMEGYRSPWGNRSDATDAQGRRVGDVVSAGLVATNGETGASSWSVIPRFTFLACTNGMCVTKDATRAIHLGGKLDQGIVRWTEDTERKNMALITAKTRDAVTTFLTVEYMDQIIAKVTEKASKKLTDPQKTIETVSKALHYTEDQQAGILSHFIQGGQVTAGGVFQAVTSFAQTIEDGDVAFDFEASALEALEVAAA